MTDEDGLAMGIINTNPLSRATAIVKKRADIVYWTSQMIAELRQCHTRAKEIHQKCIEKYQRVSFTFILKTEWQKLHPMSPLTGKNLQTRLYFHNKQMQALARKRKRKLRQSIKVIPLDPLPEYTLVMSAPENSDQSAQSHQSQSAQSAPVTPHVHAPNQIALTGSTIKGTQNDVPLKPVGQAGNVITGLSKVLVEISGFTEVSANAGSFTPPAITGNANDVPPELAAQADAISLNLTIETEKTMGTIVDIVAVQPATHSTVTLANINHIPDITPQTPTQTSATVNTVQRSQPLGKKGSACTKNISTSKQSTSPNVQPIMLTQQSSDKTKSNLQIQMDAQNDNIQSPKRGTQDGASNIFEIVSGTVSRNPNESELPPCVSVQHLSPKPKVATTDLHKKSTKGSTVRVKMSALSNTLVHSGSAGGATGACIPSIKSLHPSSITDNVGKLNSVTESSENNSGQIDISKGQVVPSVGQLEPENDHESLPIEETAPEQSQHVMSPASCVSNIYVIVLHFLGNDSQVQFQKCAIKNISENIKTLHYHSQIL